MVNEVTDGLHEEEVIFEVDSEVKKEFLDGQLKSTRSFYTYVLKKADEFEVKIGKKIYDFNIEDRDELLLVQYKNKNIWTFQTALSPLKTYVNFCILKKLVKHNENRFATILPADYKNYINEQAKENSYIPRSELREWQKQLANYQDRLIIEMLHLGARGRTEKGNTLEELVNFKVEDVRWEKKQIFLTKNNGETRYIYVDEYTLDLIKQTINQTFYIANNGFKKKKNDDGVHERTERGRVINPTEYVFRVPGKNKFDKADYQLFASRIQRMQGWLEKPYLTPSNLYFSGIIEYAKKLKNQETVYEDKLSAQGQLIREDYIQINEQFDYGENGEKYLYKTKDLVSMYINDGD